MRLCRGRQLLIFHFELNPKQERARAGGRSIRPPCFEVRLHHDARAIRTTEFLTAQNPVTSHVTCAVGAA